MTIYKFNDITEKDMDLLFMEEIIASQNFIDIFLKKIDKMGAKVIEVEHSKVNLEYGESDLTVILSHNNKKHALLIEDKIDAIAMPNQAKRYFDRGRVGVEKGDYNSFDVFIIAPEKYLKENKESQKYPHRISYEEIANYFALQDSECAKFKHAIVLHAINKQKTGYQVVENVKVTLFWDSYIDFQKKHFPKLWLSMTKGPKGSNSMWGMYKTVIDKVWIYHKCNQGVVDLTFPNQGDNIVTLETMLENHLGKLKDIGVYLIKTGKSAALRIEVPVINVKDPFENNLSNIKECFHAVERLNEIAKKLYVKN